MDLRSILIPNQAIDNSTRRYIVVGWLIVMAVFWIWSPSVFLPKPGEVGEALKTLWTDNNLAIELFSSIKLDIEAIGIATVVSLLLAYMGTIAVFRVPIALVGKLRFLSLAGLGFAFTLMTSSAHALRVSVLVFMVTVFFIVGMVDVLNSVPKEQYDLAKTLRMNDWNTLWEVDVLGQIDQAFVVLRQNAAMSFMMLSVAECMAMSGGGVGVILFTSTKHFHMAEVMAVQIVMLILGICQDATIAWLRITLCPYADLARSRS